MNDWPTWVWVLLIAQVATGFGIYKIEKGLEHVCSVLARLQHLYANPK